MRKTLAVLAGKMRRLTAGMRERPQIQIDEFELEHFLLYNGLVGSSPDNQPEYRDVRNDIVQAVNDRSPHQLAIALKLPPLWWEDRLEKIFGEIAAINREGALACLLGSRPPDDITGDTTPLSHSNWQVRSNAARMLAFLDAKEAVPRLVEILSECQNGQQTSFCHIAYALGRLRTKEAKAALCKNLQHEDDWFRVDAAGALALWPVEEVASDLMAAMLSGSRLDDYMAVAISRRHHPVNFIDFESEEIHEGVSELSVSLLKALNGPFHSEHQIPHQLTGVSEQLNELALRKPTPRRLAAAIAINNWSRQQSGTAAPAGARAITDLSASSHYDSVKEVLTETLVETPAQIGLLKHSLLLASQFRLTEFAPLLIPLAKSDFPALPELIQCLAALGNQDAAPPIAALIEQTVDLGKRCNKPFSAHPVLEDDRYAADIYWFGLKALASLPHKSSIELLARAVHDHAADKREQALSSLSNVLLSEDLKNNHFQGSWQNLLRERTEDPSSSVQAAALNAIAQHKMAQLIPEVLRALHSRELSVQRRASETLLSLSANGYRDEVKTALQSAQSKGIDRNKRTRINKVLEKLN